MPNHQKLIPVNDFENNDHSGVSIGRLTMSDLATLKSSPQSERHDRHTFHLLEKGAISIEIDFQLYHLNAPAVVYMHPNQVHCSLTHDKAVVSSWAIDDINLNGDYVNRLEAIYPAPPVLLTEETASLLTEMVSVSLKLADRQADKLYQLVLKESCNALVLLVIAQFLAPAKPVDKLARMETITKAFKSALEQNFTALRRPASYAHLLNMSTAYLNECVKSVTGYSVTQHIHQRIVLEAKRLLGYSDRSVKEIAAALGCDDYPYFAKLFVKLTGMSPLSFRRKNRV